MQLRRFYSVELQVLIVPFFLSSGVDPSLSCSVQSSFCCEAGRLKSVIIGFYKHCQLVAFCLCIQELAFCALDVVQADCQVIVKKSYQKGEYLDVICCVVCLTLVHCAWQGRAAGFCALCALQAHVKQALSSSGNVVSPSHLVKNLRCIL
jgi:hypothetical protein